MCNDTRANGHDHHDGMKDKEMMAPLGNQHLHFCGIHCAKKDPRIQIITQHYFGGVADGMHQCLLYSSAAKDAKLLGVEYIVSDEVYRSLPDVEKRYWHPHTYEVLGGGLIAPGMNAGDEQALHEGPAHDLGQNVAYMARSDDTGSHGRAVVDVVPDR
jgi:hypothetical protein